MKNFGRNLKRLRRKRGWTQEDLAREIGVSLSTVQRWETKDSKPLWFLTRELDRLFKEEDIIKDEIARDFLNAGSGDTAFLRENDISIVYSREKVENTNLVRLYENVYVLPPGEPQWSHFVWFLLWWDGHFAYSVIPALVPAMTVGNGKRYNTMRNSGKSCLLYSQYSVSKRRVLAWCVQLII